MHSEVFALNDKVEQNRDVQNMAVNELGVNSKYAILWLLADYFL